MQWTKWHYPRHPESPAASNNARNTITARGATILGTRGVHVEFAGRSLAVIDEHANDLEAARR